MVLWIIGMSGSGKTVLGKHIYSKLKSEYNNLIFIDGDIFREIMGGDLGHTLEERKKNSDRIIKFSRYMADSGINLIFSVLSIFPEARAWNRRNIKNYFEVYVKCDMDTLIKRDSKGIYKKAMEGKITDVVGVDIKFPEPVNSDMVIENCGNLKELYKKGDEVIERVRPILA